MVSFTCNICGAANSLEKLDWETPSCTRCHSNVRMRALIFLLANELFGQPLTLPEFPRRPDIRGFGMSDHPCYAAPLAKKLSYTNTYYDREPFMDITEAHPDQHASYDFILSSDVFEHVAPPIERAFDECARLLKPTGFMCVTVPASHIDDQTIEYYPDLHQYKIVELGGERVLVNRKKDNTLEVHENLEFHGGPGTTLVMRQFSQKQMAEQLNAAGFTEVEFQADPVDRFGIFFEGPWSRPFVARRGKFALGAAPPLRQDDEPDAPSHKETRMLEHRIAALESQLRAISESRWMKLGRRLGFGPKLN
jgi:SAM-dependent methyltransferase